MKILIILLFIPILCLSQNTIDSSGEKQGKWEQKYLNGILKYEGQFENDVPFGRFRIL